LLGSWQVFQVFSEFRRSWCKQPTWVTENLESFGNKIWSYFELSNMGLHRWENISIHGYVSKHRGFCIVSTMWVCFPLGQLENPERKQMHEVVLPLSIYKSSSECVKTSCFPKSMTGHANRTIFLFHSSISISLLGNLVENLNIWMFFNRL